MASKKAEVSRKANAGGRKFDTILNIFPLASCATIE